MASKPTTNPPPEEGVPSEVIAQAEAAIFGNFEDPNASTDNRRRPSIADQSSAGRLDPSRAPRPERPTLATTLSRQVL